MKNAFKKLAAFAMAFTLLGTGTAIQKAENIQGGNSMVAHAGAKSIKSDLESKFQWFDVLETYKSNGKTYACVICNYGRIPENISGDRLRYITLLAGNSVALSHVAPNFNAKVKRYYNKGESFLVKPERIQTYRDSQWIMTTSGYYVPIRIRNISEEMERLLSK